jgi:hypothetical protein
VQDVPVVAGPLEREASHTALVDILERLVDFAGRDRDGVRDVPVVAGPVECMASHPDLAALVLVWNNRRLLGSLHIVQSKTSSMVWAGSSKELCRNRPLELI